MTSCPRCGSDMVPGFLGSKNWPVGLQWYEKETQLGMNVGEPVATDRKFSMEYLRGERCVRCRVMLLAF